MMPQMLEISEHAVFGNGSGMRGTEAFLKELEYRPDEAKPIKEGILQKRVVSQDILWSNRYITLTTEKIFIRNTKDREVRDTIGVCPKGGKLLSGTIYLYLPERETMRACRAMSIAVPSVSFQRAALKLRRCC